MHINLYQIFHHFFIKFYKLNYFKQQKTNINNLLTYSLADNSLIKNSPINPIKHKPNSKNSNKVRILTISKYTDQISNKNSYKSHHI